MKVRSIICIQRNLSEPGGVIDSAPVRFQNGSWFFSIALEVNLFLRSKPFVACRVDPSSIKVIGESSGIKAMERVKYFSLLWPV